MITIDDRLTDSETKYINPSSRKLSVDKHQPSKASATTIQSQHDNNINVAVVLFPLQQQW